MKTRSQPHVDPMKMNIKLIPFHENWSLKEFAFLRGKVKVELADFSGNYI